MKGLKAEAQNLLVCLAQGVAGSAFRKSLLSDLSCISFPSVVLVLATAEKGSVLFSAVNVFVFEE